MTSERTVLLVVHTGRAEATETARRVEKVFSDNNIGLRVLSAEAVDHGPSQLAPDDMRALGVDIEVVDADPHAAEGCELVVGLGGDGTFLRTAALARNADVPVLGINLGRIGFLAEAETEAIDIVLEHVVARSYRIEERLTLDIAVRFKGEVVAHGWALNEASLEKGPRLGVLGVFLEVDGRPVSTFGCDGVLVSTPTGSTAYAFSAGGPILWPDLEALLVVPNNAHALFARPVAVLSEIRIESLGAISVATAEFDRGLTVLTGETGTGKTMVVTSLHLLGGARADANRVRSGAARAVVEGRFSTADLDEKAVAQLDEILDASGAERDEDGSIIALRSVSRDGPSRAYLGGRSVPAKSLSGFTTELLTLHGQNDQLRLMRPEEQRGALDRFAAAGPMCERYRKLRDAWLSARRDLIDRRNRARELAQEADRLKFALHEINTVDPAPGEDDALVADILRLSELDALRAAAAGARAALSGPLDD